MKNRYPKRRLGWPAAVGLMLLGSALALPSLSQAACTINPTSPTVTAGGSIAWSATNITGLSGSSSNYTYSWAFSGGNPTPTSSTSRTRTVTYNAAGNSTTSLTVRGSNSTRTSCTRAFTVAPLTLPTLSMASIAQNEGNSGTSTMTFTVSLSSPAPTGGVGFNVATANGSATAGTDYVAINNSARTIAAGASSTTVAVTINGDTAIEPNETFTVNVSGATKTANATAVATGTITNDDQPVAECNPAVNGDHQNCIIGEYTGPEVCVACHETEARNLHKSVHYQQNGPTDFVTNIAGNAGEGPAGKPSGVNAVIGVNTYCGTHENSPRFTCAGCHVGKGRFPKTEAELAALPALGQLEELANIDCLTCHQEVYKRFPDWVLPSDPNFVGGESYGFSTLVIDNVCLDASGLLADPYKVGTVCVTPSAPPYSVERTGFAGIPNVDSTTLDFQFRPAGAAGSVIPLPAGAPLPGGPMALTTEQAAKTVHATTRRSCLNCHAGAAGANGAKRGDLSTSNIASTDLTLDRHMSTSGSNMTCSDCHNVDDTPTVNDDGRPTTHRVRGRGLDLRANDHATRFTCDNAGCHNAATVHNSVVNSGLVSKERLTRHTNKVACQTCHIPRYAKGVATEVARDWQEPHVTQTACNGRGGWLPNEIKSSTATPPVPLTPSYQWFDGTSQVYYLTEPLTNTPLKPLPDTMATELNMPAGTQAYVMGRPNPNPENAATRVSGASLAAAKIYPMKEHWGKLARNVSVNNPEVPVNSLIPQSTFEFFRTGSFCRSVAEGVGQDPDAACPDPQDQRAPAGTEVVAVHTYQTLNHGVEPQANSLGVNSTCGTCHSVNGMTGGPARMDLKGQLGYRVRTNIGWTVNTSGTSSCANSCHEGKNESGNFTNVHERSEHVQRGCNSCHDQITGR